MAPSLPQDQLHFLYPLNDTLRHYCNPVKLEEEEKGIANWGKPNRGLIIAATDLDRGDITTAFDTGRPKVTNSNVWSENEQEKQEREGQQPSLNSCPKTRSRGDAAQFFLCMSY